MKRYPEYKASDVEWIGKIPRDWEIMRCAHLFEVKHIKNTSGEINLSVYRDYGVIKRDSRDDNYNRVSEDISNYKLVEPGDFVFNKMKCWQGSLGISEYRGIVSPAYTVCKPKKPFHGKYFHYLLRSWTCIQEFNRLSYGVRIGQWELRFEDFKDIVVPYPSTLEQTQIAAFLDRKTGQIDELIRIKERRIELLQEQRTALINQAVTKGLDPNVEMKPSGVEWIGEISKDQQVTRLKYICKSIVDCEHKTAPTQETGYPLIRTPNIGIGHLILDSVNRVSEETYQEWSRRTIPQSGDLILAREAPVGNVAIIPKDLKVCLGQRTVLIRPDKNKVYPMFLVYLMLGDETQAKLLERSTGAIVHHLNMTDIRNLELPRLPSLPVQHKITNFLDHKTQQIDELLSTEQRKIELLKEYRQSLISEAVTGKIDVRSEA